HNDAEPSLSISEGTDGRVLLYCHAGCDTDSILSALGMMRRDLFPTRYPQPSGNSATRSTFPTLDDAIANTERRWKMRQTRRDWYHDHNGNEHFVVVRFDSDNGKDFRPFHRNGSGWVIADPPGKLSLFHLPELIARPNEIVFIVEGEKCACELATLGLLVTTSAHGADSAHKTDWQALAGRNVVNLPDNDAGGRTYAETVARI